MSTLRENWRVVALVVLLVVSATALFVPGVPPGTSADEGTTVGGPQTESATQLTNLNYGIQLSGGTRLRAPIVGITAEGVNVTANDATQLEQTVADELGIDTIDIRVRPISNDRQMGAVEVVTENVTQQELRAALEASGHQPETVRDGVTRETRQEMVETIDEKLRTSALSGASVQIVNVPGGEHFVSITAPDRDREELVDILNERGVVKIYAVYQGGEDDSYVREEVLQRSQMDDVSAADREGVGWAVYITVRRDAADEFAQRMVDAGFGNGARCENYNHSDIQQTTGDGCLVHTLNGEVVTARGVRTDLGESFANGEFANDPVYVIPISNEAQDPAEQANEIELNLKAGQLPAPLDLSEDSGASLDPALAEQFKQNSLLTGLLAVLAVSLVVYVRYKRVEVVVPMVVTALSEVFILLGFVAFVQYPLNLSHLAGFIAVIGTGVDDLIIIADEILQEGEVETGRVFQSRFRKAFWVIGAAAATTIMAMSPLMVLPLGDLSGFAIITIVGVLIGVLVTRPAYGDILRNLVLDED
ncbi:MMPL family transporter [Haloarcula argentinensis]|uniref:Protein-export membrane protein SecD n=1 Tax=Haloarcula argentinensis TaxID=43776 RepID=A0ABU2EVI4_HALAR|nr:MMPL family transporter [Haloarcula argentinensis]EMA22391.1 preprotein translocase subunit SecD [Haloarcula argentinensis DSM 12282]MDS0252298.1 MMPL family transporter [Haloarcula argentinensis]